MKSYRIDIKPLGRWGSLLTADTFFGHLCWAMRLTRGESAVQEFLACYDSGEAPLVLSDGLPAGFLPRPILQPAERTTAEISPEQYKAIKKVPYISVGGFEKLRGALKEADVLKVLAQESEERVFHGNSQVREGLLPWIEEATWHCTIDRGIGSVLKQGGLYQTEDFLFGTDVRFNVFVRLSDFDIQTLLELVEFVGMSGYGRDASVGLGRFSVESFAEFAFPRIPDANAFMALSNFVPSPKDPVHGWYDLTVKFGKLGGPYSLGPTEKAAHCPFKKPLVMLKAGSVFFDNPVQEWYGRVVSNVHFDSRIRHYGICYALEVRV